MPRFGYPLDLLDLDLPPAQLRLRAAVVVEDSALPPSVLVKPADAPPVSMSDGLGHGPCSLPRASSPVSCNPDAIPCRNESRRSEALWPKTGPETKNAGSAPGASSRVVAELRGQDLNLRPSGYEPDELPGCSTARKG